MPAAGSTTADAVAQSPAARVRRRTSHDAGAARFLEASSVDDALRTIAVEQEAATPADLMKEMAGFVDERNAEYFMRDSGAIAP